MTFTLSANLKINPPSNLNKIVADINRKLGTINANVNLNLPSSVQRQLASANSGIKQVGESAKKTESYMEALGKSASASLRRYAGFTIFASTFYQLTRAIGASVGEAISFQRELVKIRQVSGNSLKDLKGLTDEITRLSTGFGVSSKRLLNASQVLAQAGFSIRQVNKAAETLAKIELAPTFEGIGDAAEGMIAIMGQFGTKAEDFEKQFGAINSVAAKFAVESSDIITAIRRTGGAFSAAGGSLNELIALFTSVRQTSRESAETIATGFRTIFTRIQRTRTIDFLKRLGIDLRDTKQQFIGPYEAVKRLSAALNSIPSTDVRFAQITEELGGFRQIGKVIPLIKQNTIAEQARIVALRGETSLTEDAAKAQDALAIRLTKVRESFQALIRTVSENDAFKQFLDYGLRLSEVLIKLAGSLDKILPLLAIVGAGKLGIAGAGFAKSFLPGVGLGGAGSKALYGGVGGSLVLSSLISSYGKLDKETKNLIDDFHTAGATFLALSIAFRSIINSSGQGAELQGLRGKRGPLDTEVSGLKSTLGTIISAKGIADSEVKNAGDLANSARSKILKHGSRIQGLNTIRETEIGRLTSGISNEQARQKNLKVALDIAKQQGNIAGATAASSAISSSQARENRLVTRKDTAQQQLTRGQNLLSELFTTARTGDEARAAAAERQKLLGAEQKSTTTLLNTKQAELDATNKQIKTLERSQYALTALTISAAALSGLLLAIGRHAQEEGGLQLRQGNSLGRIPFIRGGVSTGAGTGLGAGAAAGIGTGAAIGAFGGPPLMALLGTIGAGIGAVVGGIKGYTDSIKEADEILEHSHFEKNFTTFNDFLENVQKSKTSASGSIGTFRSGINLLQDRLETAPLTGKESAQGAISTAIVGIQQFLDEITKTSKSFEDLEHVVGTEVLEKFAGFIRLPYSKLRENIQKQIDSQNELSKNTNILSEAQETQLKRIQLFNGLSAALQDAIDGLDSFSDVLAGTTKVKDSSGIFGRHQSITDKGLLSRAVGQTTSPFGAEGRQIGADFIKTTEVLARLPDIITDATSKTLGESHDFVQDFEDSLLKQFPDIPDVLRNALKANILEIRGAESKDTKIFQSIQENPTELLKKIAGGILESEAKFFEENNKLLTQQLNDLASLYEKRRNLEEALVQNLSKTVDIREQRATFGFEARGELLPFAQAQSFETQRLAAARGKSPFSTVGAFSNSALASQSRIVELNQKLQKETDGREAILKELEDEKDALADATRGLEFFADVTARTAAAQKELELTQKRQRAKFDFAKDFTFGDLDTRRTLGRAALGGGVLAHTSDINRIPGDLRGDVLSFLERFEDVKLPFLGGKRGRDVIRDTVEKNLVGAGVEPEEAKRVALNRTTPAEEKLITSIDANFANAIAAQNALKDLIDNKEIVLLADIRENTRGFRDLLEKNLISVEKGKKQGEELSIVSKLGDLNKQRAVFGEITGLIGGDKDRFHNIKQALPQISEFKNKESTLVERRNNLTQLAKFSQFRIKPGFHLDQSLVRQENDEALLSDLGINGKLGDTNTNKLGSDKFKQIRESFRAKFGGQTSSEVFNNDFFNQFDTDNGTIHQFVETFRERVKNLQKNLEKDTQNQADEGQKLVRQTGLANLNELFEVAGKADKLTKLFESIPKDATFDGLSQINIQAAELARIVEKLRSDISGLNTREAALGRAGGGFIPGAGNSDTVPAMLTPGEFVIRKGAAQAIGYDNLNMMNAQGFASGGRAERRATYLANKASLRASFAAPRLARAAKYQESRAKNLKLRYKVDESGYEYSSEGVLPDVSTNAQRIAKRDREYRANIAKNAERIAERNAKLGPGVIPHSKFGSKPIKTSSGSATVPVASTAIPIPKRILPIIAAGAAASSISATPNKGGNGSNQRLRTNLPKNELYASSSGPGYYWVDDTGHVFPLQRMGGDKNNTGYDRFGGPDMTVIRPQKKSIPIAHPSGFFKKGGKVSGRQHFANGGTVQNGSYGGISPQAIESLSRFGENINKLSTSLDNFPRTVEMSVRHTVEVIHNGAQLFASLTPSVMELVEKTTENAINGMLKKKFPDVGIVN
jgi:TP901 family phage tail tape measure protein